MDVRWRNFIWNDEKARTNLRDHGVSFREGAWTIGDPYAIEDEDETHSKHERRQWLIGQSPRKRILLVIFTKRENDLIRIISVWKSTPEESEHYENEKREH